MKKKIIFLSSIFIFIVVIFVFLDCENLQRTYIQFFKLTKLITHKNKNDKLEGESIFYVRGKVNITGNFKNGLRNGLMVHFYSSGQVENKINYISDKPAGKEYGYYENGKLKYERFWQKGKLYGDLYYYFENGKMNAFHTYDITQEKINIIRYDQYGKILKIEGAVFSRKLYSITKGDSVVILENNKTYNNIDDLYVTVSTPSDFNLRFFVNINNMNVKTLVIKNNTLRIPNAFDSKGIYDVYIGAELLDKNGKVVETNYYEIKIKKD